MQRNFQTKMSGMSRLGVYMVIFPWVIFKVCDSSSLSLLRHGFLIFLFLSLPRALCFFRCANGILQHRKTPHREAKLVIITTIGSRIKI